MLIFAGMIAIGPVVIKADIVIGIHDIDGIKLCGKLSTIIVS
jgi:hypothetical protein